MLYRKMQKSGDELSVLGFGCMRLPQKKGSPGDGKIDENRATKQIRMAIDMGVNYIDTAFTYHMGSCEPFLSRALSDGYREKVKLATKMPHWLVKEKKDMDSILTSQLKRLSTEQIDYYLIHALNYFEVQITSKLVSLCYSKKHYRRLCDRDGGQGNIC